MIAESELEPSSGTLRPSRESGPGAGSGDLGNEMFGLVSELFPICRSITGPGTRETLEIIAREVPLTIQEVPTGAPVLDWTVPQEWTVRDAYIKDRSGRRVVDFRESNLHVMSYSTPIHERMPRTKLLEHVYSLPDHPDWIPYRTSYYDRNWAFCVRQSLLDELTDDLYEVCIDSTLADGALRYGELLIPGATSEEVLISTHICHPSLANDNLSGVVVAVELAKYFAAHQNRFSYRLLFVPGTIGSITWLSRNEEVVPRVAHGLVLAGLGNHAPLTYKRSRRGNSPIDLAMQHVLKWSGGPFTETDFTPYGYDERQYCSPGFNIPMGSLTRTPHGAYPEYHTSADDLSFVRPESLQNAFETVLDALLIVESNQTFVNLSPKGEPQLGRRGLFHAIGGERNPREIEMAMLWMLSMSDGTKSVLEVAECAGLRFEMVNRAAEPLLSAALLAPSG